MEAMISISSLAEHSSAAH